MLNRILQIAKVFLENWFSAELILAPLVARCDWLHVTKPRSVLQWRHKIKYMHIQKQPKISTRRKKQQNSLNGPKSVFYIFSMPTIFYQLKS